MSGTVRRSARSCGRLLGASTERPRRNDGWHQDHRDPARQSHQRVHDVRHRSRCWSYRGSVSRVAVGGRRTLWSKCSPRRPRGRDRKQKCETDTRFGVAQYWIIDPGKRRIEVYRPTTDGATNVEIAIVTLSWTPVEGGPTLELTWPDCSSRHPDGTVAATSPEVRKKSQKRGETGSTVPPRFSGEGPACASHKSYLDKYLRVR